MFLEIDYLIIIERLILAAVLGGMIGWERERRSKQAGFRTHLLVSVGSALIMLTSIYGFGDLINHPNARFDPARLAAQVISGIGFLGAGAILRHSDRIVSGLTTAATLWVVAAIGLSVGSGFYFPAIATTIIVLISVFLLRSVELKFAPTAKVRELKTVISDEAGTLRDIRRIFETEKIDIRKMMLSDAAVESDSPQIAVTFHLRISTKKNMVDVIERIQKLNGVKEIVYDK